MFVLIFFIVGTLINSVVPAKSDIYSGYSIHGVHLRDQSDQVVIYNLQIDLNVDLWDHGAPEIRDAFIMVSPENRIKVLDILDANDIEHYLHIADVARTVQDHEVALSRWQQTRQILMPFQTYPRLAEVDAYMERIAREYPNIATLVNAGNSFDGRPVQYLKISTTNFTDTSKPIYFLNSLLHAREWVTPPVALYTIHRLVEDLRSGDRDLLEDIDWIIMPIVNPDGYEYSHTDERLWRRTRSFNATVSTICYGVDANRNFDIHFNTLGVSSNPCALNYPGHEPFSEPETRYVRDILLDNIDRIQIYMDVHSHGNYVLFGFDNLTLPTNVVHLHHVASAMGASIDAVKLPEAPYYMVGNGHLVLYGASGTAQDYAQDVGIPFSFTLELPGYSYTFLVPPEYIEQINAETWQGIAVTARLSSLYYRLRNRN